MLPSHDRPDGCSTEPVKCPSRQERRFGRICRKAFCMGRRKTGAKRYPRLSLCARRTKSCRCAPPSFPAEEQVRAPRSHLVQRSEERRVGKECVSTCNSPCTQYHKNKHSSAKVHKTTSNTKKQQ